MRFNVSFRCTLPVILDAHPIGRELADYLAQHLRQAGADVAPPEVYDDSAFIIESGEERNGPYLLLGYVGQKEVEWLVEVHSRFGFVGRLMGRSDMPERKRFALQVHQLLQKNDFFQEVRWHEGDATEAGWTAAPDA